MLHKGHQRGMLVVNAVCQFRTFSRQAFQHVGQALRLLFVVGLHRPVFLLGDFPVLPVLIKGLLVTGDFGKFPFLCGNQIVQPERLAFLIGAVLIRAISSE